jgi:Type IV secretion-system coupling protein DNA-binding domain
MSTQPDSMTHGILGLELAYTLMLAAIIVGLAHARASWARFLLSALVAGPMTVFAGVVIALTSPLLRIFSISSESNLQLAFGVVVVAAMGYAAGRALAAHNRASSGPEHRRGAFVTMARLVSAARGDLTSSRSTDGTSGNDAGITLAGIAVSLEDETKHFKLIGTTGTGKSTAIREILTAALARGDRAIIADPDGGYASRFYDPARGDVILNPFDADAHKWDLFGEIINDYDIEQLARSLIPDSGDSERIWCEYARTFFTAVVRQSIRAGNRDDAELFRLVTAGSETELRTMLAGTAAGPFLEVGNEKMFGSLRSVASSAVRALEYTTRQQATPFSVRQWVQQGGATHAGGPGGVLFLPYTAGQIAALRSVISAWMRLGIFEAMDRGEGDQRLWFVVDELDALGEIDGLKDALARLRKFGGRCILGFQSIAQVSGTYGKGTAETIVENCGNTLILRCSASERGGTSEFASKLIGQREVLHTTLSKSRRSGEWRSSTTTSQHLKIEPAVMASEIERLPDLAGFLKLATVPDWQSVRLTPRSEPGVVRIRKPSVVASPPVTAAAISPTSPPTPPPVAASRRGKSQGRQGQGRAGVPKRPRKQKARAQPDPPTSGEMAAGSVTPPQITVPDGVNAAVQKQAGGGQSNQQPL